MWQSCGWIYWAGTSIRRRICASCSATLACLSSYHASQPPLGECDMSTAAHESLCGMHVREYLEGRACECRGAFEGDEAQRTSLLRAAAQQGVRYIDIDLDAAHSFFAGMHSMISDVSICEQAGRVDRAATELCFAMLRR
jgi:hypothetical protein